MLWLPAKHDWGSRLVKSCAAVAAVALECALFRSQTGHKTFSSKAWPAHLRSCFVVRTRVPRGLCNWCREGELNPQDPKVGGF